MGLGSIGRIVVAIVVAIAAPTWAMGQVRDVSFATVAAVLRPQSRVLITDQAGNRFVALVATVSDASLEVVLLQRAESRSGTVVLSRSDRRVFTPAEVSWIEEADEGGRSGRVIYTSPAAFSVRTREIKPGSHVSVDLTDKSRLTGRVRQLLPSSITIDPGGGKPLRTFAAPEIRRLRERDPLWDTPLWGAAFGAGFLVLVRFDGDTCPCPYLRAFATPVAIGVVAELAHWPTTYHRTSSAPTRLSIAPVVTKERHGVKVVITF